jgi:hypothetical protein
VVAEGGSAVAGELTLYHLRIKQKINSTLKFKEDLRKQFLLIKKKKEIQRRHKREFNLSSHNDSKWIKINGQE